MKNFIYKFLKELAHELVTAKLPVAILVSAFILPVIYYYLGFSDYSSVIGYLQATLANILIFMLSVTLFDVYSK